MNIIEYANIIGKPLVIRYVPWRKEQAEDGSFVESRTKFYAQFESAEILEGGFLIGSVGDGATPEEALSDYTRKISDKTIVFDAYANSRMKLVVPILEA